MQTMFIMDYLLVIGLKKQIQNFYDFKKGARKEVSYLVKEFECRKSASAYARANYCSHWSS